MPKKTWSVVFPAPAMLLKERKIKCALFFSVRKRDPWNCQGMENLQIG
jgi:hypothetical protein